MARVQEQNRIRKVRPSDCVKLMNVLRSGGKPVCPRCESADLNSRFMPYETDPERGWILFECPTCGWFQHFSGILSSSMNGIKGVRKE